MHCSISYARGRILCGQNLNSCDKGSDREMGDTIMLFISGGYIDSQGSLSSIVFPYL